MCDPLFAMSVTFSLTCLENSTNRNGLRPRYALAGLCATLPRTCYTMIFAASVAAATTSKAQFPVLGIIADLFEPG
jgi:hypothetical protein